MVYNINGYINIDVLKWLHVSAATKKLNLSSMLANSMSMLELTIDYTLILFITLNRLHNYSIYNS